MEENVLVMVAMKIILNAGDARNAATDALEAAKDFDFVLAESHMKKAEDAVVLAHRSQTEIIQKEANGAHYQPCLLFTHAQDTLMSIHSELRLTKELIAILHIVESRTV